MAAHNDHPTATAGGQDQALRRDWFETALLVASLILVPSQIAATIIIGHRSSPLHSVPQINIGAADVLVMICFGLWALRVLARRQWRDLIWPPFPIWAFCVVAIFSLITSPLIAEAMGSSLLHSTAVKEAIAKMVQVYAYLLIGFMLYANLLRSRQNRQLALWLLLVLTSLVVAFGVVQYATIDDYIQVKSTFGSQNIFSAFVAMILPFMLAVGLQAEQRAVRIWLALCIVVGAFTMLGGGGLLSTMIVLPWLAWRHNSRAGLFTLGCVVLGLVIMVAGNTRAYHDNLQRVFTLYNLKHDVKKEYIEWQPGLDMMDDNSPFGVGLGDYQLQIGSYYASLPNERKMPFDSNNLYLVIAASMGFLGLVALLHILRHFIGTANEAYRLLPANDRALALGAWGSLMAFCLCNVLSALLVRGTGLLWVFIMALLTAMMRDPAAATGATETMS